MDSRVRRALTADQADLLRQIPSVDELLAQPRLAALKQRVDRELLVEITRTVLADLRGRITGEGTAAVMALDSSVLEERIASIDRKSTRLNSSHTVISYAVFCLKKKKVKETCGTSRDSLLG